VSSLQERRAFSERLKMALSQNGYPSDQPSAVCREFNLRYRAKRITVHAVRKWLIGEAIPAQDKVQTLAEWLGVSAQWLRFGDQTPQVTTTAMPADNRNSRVFSEYCKLDEAGQLIVEDLILSLRRRLPGAP